ncbi:VanZ family protein [Denitratisoma oestradiolicum]|uniref:Teicoplanin resistance protein VanZ n=1 Tax=Denitratisoma oestradiolicum TaxID=311182 RepID=A0A6S6XRN8_9PROT|nr:VanZ family protein [Denitratisoma oestradiolicum]TWO80895.1 hypothetical protein CBW56_07005 [Denitratisoma oestradiolicum]CAB1367340.1 Teicoplanin resistance protein VanZ [Denitratisoma oestradiolicum]
MHSPDARPPRLRLYIAAAYTLLVIHASLYPFTGWRDSGAPLWDYLSAPWPRYYTLFDLATNVAAYIPLGFFWGAALQARLPRWLAVILAALIGASLSLSLETAQHFLPSRVPSNLDLGSNILGALAGALAAAALGRRLLDSDHLRELRDRWVVPGHGGDYGLVLLALWLLTQLNPEILLFGCGDLRQWLGLAPSFEFDAERFSRIETGIAAAGSLAVGMVAAGVLLRRRGAALALLFVLAILVHSLASALLVAPDQALHWLTPGNRRGLILGLLLLLPGLWLNPVLGRVLAASALLFATALVNLAPENPYLAQATQVWAQGHFLNFNGLTRLTSMLWPFLALPWLLLAERDPWKASKA